MCTKVFLIISYHKKNFDRDDKVQPKNGIWPPDYKMSKDLSGNHDVILTPLRSNRLKEAGWRFARTSDSNMDCYYEYMPIGILQG